MQPELGILTGLKDPYLSMTSSLLTFRKHNPLTSKHCLNLNPTIGLSLESLRREIGALPICCKCDKGSKPPLKVNQFRFKTLQWQILKATCKSNRPCRPAFQ